VKLTALLLSALLVTAACSLTGDKTAADAVTPTTSQATTTSSTASETDAKPDYNLAFAEDFDFEADVEEAVATPPSDSGSAVPATSSGGGSGVPSTPANVPKPGIPQQYTGFLGTVDIDDILYGAPALAPIAVPGTGPLTGLPGSVPNHRAVIVKIDNSSKARPQSGLNAADIVFEEQVEGGITRLAAVFHTNTPTVGPVRSGRSTDISFINAFGGAALAYSGANKVIDALLLRQTTIVNFSADRSAGYWREKSRRAPSNLYTDVASFAAGGSNPPAQFAYGTPTGGTPTNTVSVTFPKSTAVWSWSGGAWTRKQNGSSHTTNGGAQVSAANVVVVVVPEVATGLKDSAGFVVPEYVFAGSGPASVFTAGQRIDGTWTRPTLRSPAIFIDTAGNVIELTAGRTWVELVVAGGYSSS
jgi:hypothetical protein